MSSGQNNKDEKRQRKQEELRRGQSGSDDPLGVTDRKKEGWSQVALQGSGRAAGWDGVTLETERTAEKALGGEEEIALGHAGFEVLNFGSQDAQEVWVSGENTVWKERKR